ncbi:MAG: hypothetical protein II251_07315 [Lachnospiraceae bacterium]|nr:hypothetical protein [Lachnospiraceae bacterium]
MYQVTVETYNKKSKEMIDHMTIVMDDFDTGIRRLEDLLYGLDVEYDDIEGDGDMVIDDMLMCASEEEEFIEVLEGKKHIYKIIGNES